MRRRLRARSIGGIDDKARRALRAAHAVVLDATFSTARERAAAARVAAEVGVAFDGLFLEAPLARGSPGWRRRRADASDADAASREGSGPSRLHERGWSPIDASGELEATLERAARRLGLGASAAERSET